MPIKMIRSSPCGSPFANRRHSLASSRKLTTFAGRSITSVIALTPSTRYRPRVVALQGENVWISWRLWCAAGVSTLTYFDICGSRSSHTGDETRPWRHAMRTGYSPCVPRRSACKPHRVAIVRRRSCKQAIRVTLAPRSSFQNTFSQHGSARRGQLTRVHSAFMFASRTIRP